jgi:hypothetical protein
VREETGTPVESLELSGYTFRALRKAKIESVEELRELYESGQLLKRKGIGPGTVQEVAEKLGHEVVQKAPPPVPRERRATPTIDHLVFRCDRFPEHKVLIPAWQKAQLTPEFVRFRGGVLHLAEFAERYGLSPDQVSMAEEHLLTRRWIYREHPLPGETIICHVCGTEFRSASLFRQHELWAHGEELNAVRAQRPK